MDKRRSKLASALAGKIRRIEKAVNEARAREARDTAAPQGQEMPALPPPPAVLAIADACAAKEACEPMPRKTVQQQRALLMAAHVALKAARGEFHDYRDYEACTALERAIATRLGELELKGA